jgi:hypothetical protein
MYSCDAHVAWIVRRDVNERTVIESMKLMMAIIALRPEVRATVATCASSRQTPTMTMMAAPAEDGVAKDGERRGDAERQNRNWQEKYEHNNA